MKAEVRIPMNYSIACEEMAYSKDADSLRKAADGSFDQANDYPIGDKVVWTPPKGSVSPGHGVWFSLWADRKVGLLFNGTEADALERIRKVADRSMD